MVKILLYRAGLVDVSETYQVHPVLPSIAYIIPVQSYLRMWYELLFTLCNTAQHEDADRLCNGGGGTTLAVRSVNLRVCVMDTAPATGVLRTCNEKGRLSFCAPKHGTHSPAPHHVTRAKAFNCDTKYSTVLQPNAHTLFLSSSTANLALTRKESVAVRCAVPSGL